MDVKTRKWRALLVAALAGALLIPTAAVASDGPVPGNVGNLDDGGPVDPADVLALVGVNTGWLPPASDLLRADCEATADPAGLVERNGLVLIRGWGHWSCNMALPANYLQVCLDLVFPSVNCNDKLKVAPSSGISLPVDFPCAPGAWITMAEGENIFDTNPTNNVSHSNYVLLVLPQDCEYLAGGRTSSPRLVPLDEVPEGTPIRIAG